MKYFVAKSMLSFACIVLMFNSANCQEDPAAQPAVANAPGAAIYTNPNQSPFGNIQSSRTAYGLFSNSKHSKEERELNGKLRKHVADIKAAADESSVRAVATELRETLNALFDFRMKRRQKEIEELQNRIAELKKLNEQRVSRKDEIVELKMKSVVNEAKGLGF
ncbi:hypothetical protein N9242_03280 [Vicingaceae bacterium]|nr:hypothetical protein [Vicingaceae bacterium]